MKHSPVARSAQLAPGLSSQRPRWGELAGFAHVGIVVAGAGLILVLERPFAVGDDRGRAGDADRRFDAGNGHTDWRTVHGDLHLVCGGALAVIVEIERREVTTGAVENVHIHEVARTAIAAGIRIRD